MADYKTNKYEVTKLSKSIVKIHSIEPTGLKLEEVNEIKELLLKLTDGNKYAILRTTTENYFSTDKVRSLIAGKGYSKNRYASAFVVKSGANKISAQFYLQFHKPLTPTKIFDDEEKALEWLKEEEGKQYPPDN